MDTPSGHEISKVHTIISHVCHPQGDLWSLKDNGSMNGTFVNAQKIQRRQLHSGDEIVLEGVPTFAMVISSSQLHRLIAATSFSRLIPLSVSRTSWIRMQIFQHPALTSFVQFVMLHSIHQKSSRVDTAFA
jgi:hypothetical protein